MKDLPTTYNPKDSEQEIYSFWENNNYFKVNADSNYDPYSIVIPPPNVTGVLHMGHALDSTIQDILIRYHRMLGFETLWLPGTDHAGIATQNVIEKKLGEEGKARYDIGREEFLNITWKWANEHKKRILGQFKRLGASFDLSRERFTLDEGCSKAVKEVFVSLYKKDLIYKGSYIVNWCPRCNSAISDIETEYETEQGHLWEISYPFKDKFGALVIATTRPETLFGDVAVAVNPNDPRYGDLVGETVALPLTGREVPIIADEAVEADFGTGALKITPAHDPNDYEIGKRHNLNPIWIMDKKGNMADNDFVPNDYKKLSRFEARKKVVDDLERHGLLIRIMPHEHNVGHCQRCNDTVEPYLSEQWFVRMKQLSEIAIKAISANELNFVPERWTKIYLDWMENIRDWCISRQLWWGHQIPAYYCDDCGAMIVAAEKPEKCDKCPSSKITQDTDVLDTWFSSALWPFSTMGWPDLNSADFKKFYPTSTLVTGFDIIFFWVARMVVMGFEFTNQSPFKNVLIHGLIRDEHGRKMSKSKGNTIDPVEIIDKYGADALRFTLTSLITYGGQDIKVSDERFEFGRNFANKIWNASRFVLMNLEGVDENPIDQLQLTIADKWILNKYNETVKNINKNIKEFRLGETAQILYEFFWNFYCDWYLELAKIQLQNEELKLNTQRVLRFILEKTLRLLHPLMPFITEKIWQLIPGKIYKSDSDALVKAKYPQFDTNIQYESSENEMSFIIELIRSLRNLRQSLNISASRRIKVIAYVDNESDKEAIEQGVSYICNLAKVENMEIKKGVPEKTYSQSATSIVKSARIIVPLVGLIDIDNEISRQNKKFETLKKEQQSLEVRMKNSKFVNNAPKEVIEQTNNRIKEISYQLELIDNLLRSLAVS